MADEKAPTYYIPVSLIGVIEEGGLRTLLDSKEQTEWKSPKRIAGLLLIVDLIARKGGKLSMSLELSRQYVSAFKRTRKPNTIRQPLALLTHLGLIEMVQKAVVAPHRKASARYRLNPDHGKPRTIQAAVSLQQATKMATATDRQQILLNRKHRTREGILATLGTVGLSPVGKEMALQMLLSGEKSKGISRFWTPLNNTALHKVSFDPSGTAHHFVMYCPRELKPHLTLSGDSVSIVDMKAAHLVALLCCGRDRVAWMAKNGRNTGDLEAEISRYKVILESGDIYEVLGGMADRKKFKLTLLASLNMANSKAIHLPAYQKLKSNFPRITGIIEDLKKNDHRSLSKQLQHFTARIIERATHELQRIDIACLPDTDALIVPANHKREARRILNEAIQVQTGLRFTEPTPEP